jgi:DNA topoisomerase-3
MGKTLIVAEKPSVGRDIAEALPGAFVKRDNFLEGGDFVITWAVGHLVELAEPEDYDERLKKWKKADLPIVPGKNGIDRFKLRPRTGDSRQQLNLIHELVARDDIDSIINACDAGREGELIFAYTMDLSKVKKPVRRLWISSMTKKSILEGFEHLRNGDEMLNLEASARARSEADWLVGMNATRAATIRARSAFGGVVSLGRVQTPTLGILATREREIAEFVPETYFLVSADFATPDDSGREWQGMWFDHEKPAVDKRANWLASADAAQEVLDRVIGKAGIVEQLEIKKQNERPALLYDLTSLQRDANRRFGYSARRTLNAAQALYEQHKVLTYPRTNSRYLSTDMIPELQQRAANFTEIPVYREAAKYVAGLSELPLERIVDDKKVDDHHAIIPTEQVAKIDKLRDDEKRIYDLVVRRYLAAFHPTARYELTTIITAVEEHRFRSKGRVLIEPGWKAVYGLSADAPPEDGQEPDEKEKVNLPKLEQGEAAQCLRAEQEEKQTKPPARYTEGTLLSAMETAGKLVDDDKMREAMKERGLGTPATRAQIIELLVNRQYIQREGKNLRVTSKGMKLIEILEGHPLTSPEMTGNWEKQLRDIEHGDLSGDAFMKEIVDFTEQTVEKIMEIDRERLRMQRAVLGPCPRCAAAGREEMIRENARAFGCTSWKSKEETGCGFVIWRTIAGRQLMPDEARELLENRVTSEELQGFRSRAGKPFKAKLRLTEEDKVEFVFDGPAPGSKRRGSSGKAAAQGEDGAQGSDSTDDASDDAAEATSTAAGAAT